MAGDEGIVEPTGLTLFQRYAVRRLRRKAGLSPDEPLSADNWLTLWEVEHSAGGRVIRKLLPALPHGPRCSMCAAPFAGIGRLVTRPLGYRPSRKNPFICATCVEMSPPGGMTMDVGILFADIRGFTAASEGSTPAEVSQMLTRFYGCAEDVLFPGAIIDKLIGDEVMALYLPPLLRDVDVPALMLEHAAGLLSAVGYGSEEPPFVELGIGLDFGEAFVGNIGNRAVFDFTAVGDVVNTAARLTDEAGPGEVVASSRIVGAEAADGGSCTPISVTLKGKSAPEPAYRITRG